MASPASLKVYSAWWYFKVRICRTKQNEAYDREQICFACKEEPVSGSSYKIKWQMSYTRKPVRRNIKGEANDSLIVFFLMTFWLKNSRHSVIKEVMKLRSSGSVIWHFCFVGFPSLNCSCGWNQNNNKIQLGGGGGGSSWYLRDWLICKTATSYHCRFRNFHPRFFPCFKMVTKVKWCQCLCKHVHWPLCKQRSVDYLGWFQLTFISSGGQPHVVIYLQGMVWLLLHPLVLSSTYI